MNKTPRYARLVLAALVAVLVFAAMSFHGHDDGHHEDCPLCLASVQPATIPVLAWSIALFWFVLSILITSVIRHDRIWHSALPATRAPPF